MKIFPFTPGLGKSPEAGETRPGRDVGTGDFGSYLDQAKSKSLMDKISIENRLASQGSLEDVGLAGSLLSTLVGQISSCQPGSLDKLHNLDGILYYWQL
ncbi:MAG: hypothetical protein LBO05_02575 [Deltaproteobacteria bacterium]|jgi:hypothetical protein|nr:hypothetical protein [Deltaproteobacteria bacterium]